MSPPQCGIYAVLSTALGPKINRTLCTVTIITRMKTSVSKVTGPTMFDCSQDHTLISLTPPSDRVSYPLSFMSNRNLGAVQPEREPYHSPPFLLHAYWCSVYSGRKITASIGNVTVRGEKDGKSKGEARWPTVCLSMYSITENIYYSQLSSVELLLQSEPNCFTLYYTRKGLGSLSLCALVLRSSPPSHMSTCNGQRSLQLFCVHYTIRCYFSFMDHMFD
jgi:hypothetical protein